MSAYVVIQLVQSRRATRTRERAPPALAQHKVKQLLTEHGAELIGAPEPTPGSDEITSATISVSDMACARKLAAALREVDGIETAYAKPAEEAP